jgi:trehalose 6-phosphate synthase
LIVNPYDTDQMASALRAALEMPQPERQARMHRMRESVLEHNIYRWGANLITALSQIRTPSPEPVAKV